MGKKQRRGRQMPIAPARQVWISAPRRSMWRFQVTTMSSQYIAWHVYMRLACVG